MAVATGDLFIDGVTDMKQGLNFLVPVTDTGNDLQIECVSDLSIVQLT